MLRTASLALAVLITLPCVSMLAQGQEATRLMVGDQTLQSLHLLEPLWESPIVYRESSVLLRSDTQTPVARLAFPAKQILEIRSADGTVIWNIGEGVELLEDGLTLEFTTHAPIEVIENEQLYPPRDAPQSYRHRVGDPETSLLYAAGSWFHAHNVEVTYVRSDVETDELENWKSREPAFLESDSAAEVALPRTIARLRSGEPLKIGISGDSISTGLDASALTSAAPNQPGYPDLLVAQLQSLSSSQIELVNRAVAGWSVANGVSDLEKLLESEPDLIVIAYGMNDVGRRDPQWYRDQTAEMIRRIREHNAQIEIVLVSTMLGNSEWVHTPSEMFPLYRDQLVELSGPGVALADVTEVWTQMLSNKHFLDLTGNGLNHPNDCGHRLYAQAVLQLLVTRK